MHAFDATSFDMAAYDTPALILSLPVRVDVSVSEIAVLPVMVSVFSAQVSTNGGAVAAVWALLVFVRGVGGTGTVVGART